MIAPSKSTSAGALPAGRAEAVKERVVEKPKKTAAGAGIPAVKAAPPNVNDDKVTISENASIDLTMFNYIDKGGSAAVALAGEGGSKESFTPKPSFVGISVTRYNQMKSEIEQNFASDPEAQNRYLKELERALDDYIMLQAKIAEQLANDKQSYEQREGEEESAPVSDSEEIAKLKQLYQVGSKETQAIINKVLGDSESALPEKIDKAVDELFIDAYRQRTGASQRMNLFGAEVRTQDPQAKQAWETIKIHLDREE